MAAGDGKEKANRRISNKELRMSKGAPGEPPSLGHSEFLVRYSAVRLALVGGGKHRICLW